MLPRIHIFKTVPLKLKCFIHRLLHCSGVYIPQKNYYTLNTTLIKKKPRLKSTSLVNILYFNDLQQFKLLLSTVFYCDSKIYKIKHFYQDNIFINFL